MPTCGIRDVDEAKIRVLSVQVKAGQAMEPVSVFETDGYLLIIDGHHRWAAHILANKTTGVPARILTPHELAEASPLAAETIIQEVSWSSVYDWEDALSVRLISGIPEAEEREAPLLILSGPSGVGKSRILEELRKRGVRLANLATTTTRAKRHGEIDGTDYDFVDEDEFDDLVSSGTFCEWQYVHGHYYGSRTDRLFQQRNVGLRIKDLDAYGALQIKSLYPSSTEIIFVDVDEFDKIRQRLHSRGSDDPAQALRRISRARIERELRTLFDAVVINDVAENAAQEVIRQSRRSSANEFAVPFFETTKFHGTYVQLEFSNSAGEVVVWNNLKEKITPLLLIPARLSVDLGLRFLEQIVLDQLSTELIGDFSESGLLRTLTRAIDSASTIGPQFLATNCGSSFYTKQVICEEFVEFAKTSSRFFDASNEIWPGYSRPN